MFVDFVVELRTALHTKQIFFFPLLYFDVLSLQLSLCWALNRPLVPYTPSMTVIIQPFLDWHPPHTHPNLPSSLFHHTILLCWRVRRQVPIATRHFCWPRPRFAWQICRTFLQTHAHMQTHAAGCIWTNVRPAPADIWSSAGRKDKGKRSFKYIFFIKNNIHNSNSCTTNNYTVIWDIFATIITLERWRIHFLLSLNKLRNNIFFLSPSWEIIF